MLLVGIGGFFGAISRYLLGKWISSKASKRFPLGTWVINISGSFLLGFLSSLQEADAVPAWLWLLLGAGYLGAYTTFSTFGYEAMQLFQNKETKSAVWYIAASIVLGIWFAWMGNIIGPSLLG